MRLPTDILDATGQCKRSWPLVDAGAVVLTPGGRRRAARDNRRDVSWMQPTGCMTELHIKRQGALYLER